jgi:hypothetical protein
MDEHVTRLSLAVQLTDEFAPTARPVGAVSVTLRDRPCKALLNPSGHRLFLDLPAGDVVVEVRSTHYLDEERAVSLPLADPRSPVLAVLLKPRWPYPFPGETTLLQGRVTEAGGLAIAGGRVELVGTGLETRTAGDGRFVLYVTGLTEDEQSARPLHVSVVAGRRLLEARGGAREFSLRVTHPEYAAATRSVRDVEEGQVLTLPEPLVLTRP